MSTILPSARGKSWVFQVTALCVVLGALLGLSLKTYKRALKNDMPNRPIALQQAYREIKQNNEELQGQIAHYKKRYDELTEKLARSVPGSELLQKTLAESRTVACMTPMHGPGIVVVLRDSPDLSPNETDPDIVSQYMVHDKDLLQLVNELLAAGAEAITVNNERWTGSSSIRCVGPSIMMNTIRLTPPYTVRAIGDSAGLHTAVMQQAGPMNALILLNMVNVRKVNDVVVPGFAGSTRFVYAKPADEPGKNE